MKLIYTFLAYLALSLFCLSLSIFCMNLSEEFSVREIKRKINFATYTPQEDRKDQLYEAYLDRYPGDFYVIPKFQEPAEGRFLFEHYILTKRELFFAIVGFCKQGDVFNLSLLLKRLATSQAYKDVAGYVDIDFLDEKFGYTLAQIMFIKNKIDIFKVLLENGASIRRENRNKKSLISLMDQFGGREEMKRMIRECMQ